MEMVENQTLLYRGGTTRRLSPYRFECPLIVGVSPEPEDKPWAWPGSFGRAVGRGGARVISNLTAWAWKRAFGGGVLWFRESLFFLPGLFQGLEIANGEKAIGLKLPSAEYGSNEISLIRLQKSTSLSL